MTYSENNDDHEVESAPELGFGNFNQGKYVNLRHCNESETPACSCNENSGKMFSWWWWIKALFVFVFLGALAFVCFKWVGPYVMEKDVIPIIRWEARTFSPPMLGLIIFVSVALFPTLLLPSSPSMWVAGMTFGYGLGFLLIITAVSVGISIPYFLGSLFSHKLHVWLERYPKNASIIRSAGEGNWFHQFKAVALIRISPFPYILYNYCAVATNVRYGPYFFGSLIGIVPEVFVAIYTGIFIHALADASNRSHALSATQVIFNVAGFCATVATTVVFTIYARKQLNTSNREEALPLLE